jgi:hypothetical protein
MVAMFVRELSGRAWKVKACDVLYLLKIINTSGNNTQLVLNIVVVSDGAKCISSHDVRKDTLHLPELTGVDNVEYLYKRRNQ